LSDSTFELELIGMAHGGSALGRHDKRTVFVPYTIPGERILARVVEERGRVIFAEGVTLLEASADRLFPRCKHFGPGRCGRCQWQHIDYPAQLLIKQDVLSDQLARVGGFDTVDIQPVIPSALQWAYNHHMTMNADAEGIPGFTRTDGNGTLAVEECHILHPDLLALYESLDLQFAGLRRMSLRLGSDGKAMLILTMQDDNAPSLETDMPVSINMLLEDNEPVNLIGESHSRYQVYDRSFRVTAGSFFRPNLTQLPELVALVVNALQLQGGESVLDLYGGVGLYSAFVAEQAGYVTLVESYPPAVTDADENLADIEHLELIEGAAEDVLPELEPGFDCAIIDPPGDGLSAAAVDAICAHEIPRLVYVSSDPATFARDAKRLCTQGYRLVGVQPIDLAPQTYYIDLVAILEWAGRPSKK
jgi:23S rRNA (uracil1939-C5)-methyltransferase